MLADSLLLLVGKLCIRAEGFLLQELVVQVGIVLLLLQLVRVLVDQVMLCGTPFTLVHVSISLFHIMVRVF